MSAHEQVTIRQVAQKAGVSTQTVSRVLNDRPDVAVETRERVQQIIEQLGYKPSAIARSLIRRRSHTIGIVVAELWQYGPMRRLLGMEQAATEYGYRLHLNLVHHPDTDQGDQILDELLAWQVDGIVWAIPEISRNRHWLMRKASQLPVPVIMVSEQPLYNEHAVSIDNRAGGVLATQHLLSQGYQHIGTITGPLKWAEAQQRMLGWKDTLPTHQNHHLFEGDWSAASGEAGLRQLRQQYPNLDAVFVSNDQMALGVLQAAHQLGLRVPEDLGLIGFDNIPEAAYFYPPLTTIRHKLADQGRIVVQQLVKMIEAKRNKTIFSPEGIVLQPELIIRKSSIRNVK